MTFPESIETDRLILRRLTPEDFTAVSAYATDPDVMHYMEEGVLTHAGVRQFLERNSDSPESVGVVLKEEDRVIGHLAFHPWHGPRTYEIGWVLHPDHHRRGYTTEAAAALLRYGFEALDLHRIIATCQPENIASWRVMEKLGMRREAWFQKCIYRGGDIWWDEYFYALLQQEWSDRRPPDPGPV